MITQSRAIEISREYYRNIYGFCFSRIGNEQDAKDVTQEVFKTFCEKKDMLDDSNIRAWLIEVAARKIRAMFKKRKKELPTVSFDDEIYLKEHLEELTCDLELLDYVEEERVLTEKDKIIENLLPDERKLYYDIYRDGKKYAEIAEDLGISESAVNMRSYRLRCKIEKIVKTVFAVFAFLLLGFLKK